KSTLPCKRLTLAVLASLSILGTGASQAASSYWAVLPTAFEGAPQLSAKLSVDAVPRVSVGSALEFPVVFENLSSIPLTLSEPTLEGEAFNLVESSCGTQVAPGATCSLLVQFAPMAVGPQSGTLSLATEAGVQRAILVGEGVSSELAMTPIGAGAIGPVQLETVGVTETITLRNNGSGPAAGLSLSLDNSLFTLVNNTCQDSLGVQEACTFQVQYAPTEAGA